MDHLDHHDPPLLTDEFSKTPQKLLNSSRNLNFARLDQRIDTIQNKAEFITIRTLLSQSVKILIFITKLVVCIRAAVLTVSPKKQ
jgi:hypothetical protein